MAYGVFSFPAQQKPYKSKGDKWRKQCVDWGCDKEGRVITAEYPDFFLVTVYTPNSQRELARLDYRME